MILYALSCEHHHEFEAWFSASADFESQQKANLVQCPYCQSPQIQKQIMSPAIKTDKKTTRNPSPEQAFADAAGAIRKQIQDTHEYVGEQFADTARAMHLGEAEEKPIYGEVSKQQAKDLNEEGIPATPLPAPFDPGKPKKLN